ncbi:L,D-transpeptidase family protein [Saccharibacillus sp. CPCC 101409]|uniref:L,D-transpeptidase family protein n=1 Tax=Saccharibacillus sp. CPCC 101409 TaxID=3058041 RepID=UPI0026732549|nr:L,D-transpeptidase family protein [Saccharibacillus sp. CPCC 101409]MDO3408194.1 L,D-transpeptidase family protein [Saccharibacillus sp. CPCC 101409]
MKNLRRWTAVLTLLALIVGSFSFVGSAQAAGSEGQLIIINKKTNQLAFFDNGKLNSTFPVATGKSNDLTPEGKFKIVMKIKNRPYYKEHIAGGDPKNPLGDRWLGLEVGSTYGTTYAVHGNNNENSIGKYVSAGCIRMHNEDIRWLYDQVDKGSYAVIVSSDKSFEQLAANSGYSLNTTDKFTGKVFVNGKQQKLDDAILMIDSRLYLPLREGFGLLGGIVDWNPNNMTVTATVGKKTIVHKAKSTTAKVNGKSVEMTASRLIGNKLYVPLRDVSKLSGYTVKWNGEDNLVSLIAPK